jgi:hypothetical protein
VALPTQLGLGATGDAPGGSAARRGVAAARRRLEAAVQAHGGRVVDLSPTYVAELAPGASRLVCLCLSPQPRADCTETVRDAGTPRAAAPWGCAETLQRSPSGRPARAQRAGSARICSTRCIGAHRMVHRSHRCIGMVYPGTLFIGDNGAFL